MQGVHLPGGEKSGRNVFVPFPIRSPAPVDHLEFIELLRRGLKCVI